MVAVDNTCILCFYIIGQALEHGDDMGNWLTRRGVSKNGFNVWYIARQ